MCVGGGEPSLPLFGGGLSAQDDLQLLCRVGEAVGICRTRAMFTQQPPPAIYSRTPVSVDWVSAVSIIRGLSQPENIKWRIPEITDS